MVSGMSAMSMRVSSVIPHLRDTGGVWDVNDVDQSVVLRVRMVIILGDFFFSSETSKALQSGIGLTDFPL